MGIFGFGKKSDAEIAADAKGLKGRVRKQDIKLEKEYEKLAEKQDKVIDKLDKKQSKILDKQHQIVDKHRGQQRSSAAISQDEGRSDDRWGPHSQWGPQAMQAHYFHQTTARRGK